MLENVKNHLSNKKLEEESKLNLLEMAMDDEDDMNVDAISPEEAEQLEKIIDKLPEDVEDTPEEITDKDIKEANKKVVEPTTEDLVESLSGGIIKGGIL